MPGEGGIYRILGKVLQQHAATIFLAKTFFTAIVLLSQLTGGYVFMHAKHSPLHSMDHSFSRQTVFNVTLSVLWAFVEMT